MSVAFPVNTLQSTDIGVLLNGSPMNNRALIPKVREMKWKPGWHAIFVSNRYGDGPFFYDWQSIESPEGLNTQDWNVVVFVRETT